jgi:hypothetical protein
LSSWNNIITIYEDIISSSIDESDLVIDLEDAISGRSVAEYHDSQLFFQRSFITKSLHFLLENICKKFQTGEGSSVYSIRTPFGGGKTHTLLNIYHFLSGKYISEKLFSGLVQPENVRIGRIVGTHINPLIGNNKNELSIKTLWGELAYQIGGKKGYKEFIDNDQKLVSPGKIQLKTFLEKNQPFILLFDEILEYIVKAQGVSVINTDLGAQTLAFIQELVETIAFLPKAMLVVTLPTLEEEIFTTDSKKLLKKLLKILGRIETLETPISRLEILSIVQKRILKEVLDEKGKEIIINKYIDRLEYSNRFFNEMSNSEIEIIFYQSFPFHPDVLLTLIDNWDSFESFQRIRGVLRVVHYLINDIVNNEVKSELILPSNINFENNQIKEEFLKHIGSKFGKILNSDILEIKNKIKSNKYHNSHYINLFKDLAVTIFFHSFSKNSIRRITESDLIHLLVNDDIHPKMISEAINYLTNHLWYLNEQENSYQFGIHPNLNKIIADIKSKFKGEAPLFLKKLLTEKLGTDLLGFIWPRKSSDIPDNQVLKLVLIHPEVTIADIQTWIDKKGRSFRLYTNTIILSYPNIQEYDKCIDLILTLHAIEDIKKNQHLYFLPNSFLDVSELDIRLDIIRKNILYKVFSIYNTVLVSNHNVDLGFPEDSTILLSSWVKHSLIEKEKIVNKLHPRVLTTKFLKENQKYKLKDILNHFLKSSDLFMLESSNTLRKTVQQGLKHGNFGLVHLNEINQTPSKIIINKNINLKEITFSDKEYLVNLNYINKITEKKHKNFPNIKSKEDKENFIYSYSIRLENVNSEELKLLNSSLDNGIDSEGNELSFNVEISLKSKEGIEKKTIEKKIRETLSQLGANVTKEDFE